MSDEKKRHPVRNFFVVAALGAAGMSYAYESGAVDNLKEKASPIVHTITFGNFGAPKSPNEGP